MTSVDSGVETGNDSNDSAQTENQHNNQGFIKATTMATSTDTQLQTIQKQELDVAGVNMSMMPTSTLICHHGSLHPVTSHNHFGADTSRSVVVFSFGTDDTKAQFKTPSTLVIHQKCLKKTFEASYPPTKYIPEEGPEEELNSMSLRESSVQRSKRHESRSAPFCKYVNNPWGGRKMRLAAATNNTELMQRLLDKGVSPNSFDEHGRTALHLASCRGYTEIVEMLLDYGADPNQIDIIGNTPLHLAAVSGKGAVVKLLLDAGTDVTYDRLGYDPLQLAQTKLRMLQTCNGANMNRVKEEVHQIISMLLTYLQKQKDGSDQIETLTSFCSRISLSNTTDQVQDDVKELLASIDALSLKN